MNLKRKLKCKYHHQQLRQSQTCNAQFVCAVIFMWIFTSCIQPDSNEYEGRYVL